MGESLIVGVCCDLCEKIYPVAVKGVTREEVTTKIKQKIASKFFDQHLPAHVDEILIEWEEEDAKRRGCE